MLTTRLGLFIPVLVRHDVVCRYSLRGNNLQHPEKECLGFIGQFVVAVYV
jgi:hypothetical protein